MKNKLMAALGAAVISAGVIGGAAFASGIDNNSKDNQPIAAKESSIKASPLATQNGDIKKQDLVGTTTANNSSLNGSNTNTKQTTVEDSNEKVKTPVNEKSKDNTNYNRNSANSPSKDVYQDMTKIMRDNGFEDAAKYMQTGNYAAMRDYMNNLSQEDYDKMIKIMNDNGYGYMAQMMQSIGKEGMTQIHNSMMGNGSYSNGMMGNFR